MSTKAFNRALGLSQLTPANIVKESTTGNTLAYSDYLNFWNSLQRTQSGATKMMFELLNKFVEVERQKLKKKKSATPKEEETLERLLWMLVNSIRFVDLFLGVEANNQYLRKAHRAYESHRYEFPATSPSMREIDAFLKTVFRSVFESADTTNALVSELAFVNSVEWTLEANAGARDLSFSVLRDCPFVGLRLMSKISSGGKEAYMSFLELVKLLKSLPSMIRAQPHLMNSFLGNATALLVFIKDAFSFFPVTDVNIIRECIEAVKCFRCWPIPFGPFAAHLMEMLKNEWRLPGAAMRRKLRHENPMITEFGAHQVDKYGSQGLDWAYAHRTVTVLHNSTIPRSHVLRKLIARGLYKGKAWTNEMNQTREDILVSFLQSVLAGDRQDPTNWYGILLAAFKSKSPSEVNELYDRVMRCIDHKTNSFDTNKLLAIVNDISPNLASKVSLRRLFSEEEEDEFEVNPESFKQSFDASQWSHTVPRFPHLSFEFLEIFNSQQRRALTQEFGALRKLDEDDEDRSLFKKDTKTDLRRNKRSSLTIPGLDMFNMNPDFNGKFTFKS